MKNKDKVANEVRAFAKKFPKVGNSTKNKFKPSLRTTKRK